MSEYSMVFLRTQNSTSIESCVVPNLADQVTKLFTVFHITHALLEYDSVFASHYLTDAVQHQSQGTAPDKHARKYTRTYIHTKRTQTYIATPSPRPITQARQDLISATVLLSTRVKIYNSKASVRFYPAFARNTLKGI